MRTIAAILAGGSGTRIGGETPKQMLLLGGRPVIAHAIGAFDAHPGIDDVVVVCREDLVAPVGALVVREGFRKVRAVVPGGATRTDSSRAAVRAVEALCSGERFLDSGLTASARNDKNNGACNDKNNGVRNDENNGVRDDKNNGVRNDEKVVGNDAVLLLHDAARPLVDAGVIDRCLAALESADAVEPAIPLADTVVRVDETGLLMDVPPREALRAVQTPQCFRLALLAEAYRRLTSDQAATPHPLDQTTSSCHFDQAKRVEKSPLPSFTDDISLLRHYIPEATIRIVEGSVRNRKLTVPEDMVILEAMVRDFSTSASPPLEMTEKEWRK